MSAKTYSFVYKKNISLVDEFFQQFEEEHDAILDEIQYIRYQEEQGEKDDEGITHLQGIIQFRDKRRPSGAQRFFNDLGAPIPVIDKCHKGPLALYNYCRKQHTRVADGAEFKIGEFIKGGAPKRKRDDEKVTREQVFKYFLNGGNRGLITDALGIDVVRFNLDTLQREANLLRQARYVTSKKEKAVAWWDTKAYKWQKDVRAILEAWHEEENDRKTLVILDRKGGAGKTQFAKNYKDLDTEKRALMLKGNVKDMTYLLKDYVELDYVMLNYTRDDEKYGCPKFLEMLADGIIQSPKYRSLQMEYPNVQTVVMTNNELLWCKLSLDRWVVYEIDHGYVLNGGEPVMYKWDDETLEQAFADSEKAAKELEQKKKEIPGLDTTI